MRFTEERSLSPTREPPTRSASATRGPPAVFDVADVVGPPGPIYDSGTPHALGDRIFVLGVERITQFGSNLAIVAMPVSTRCCAPRSGAVPVGPEGGGREGAHFRWPCVARLTRVFAGLQPPDTCALAQTIARCMGTSIRLAEHGSEGHDEELITPVVADMQDPVTPILETALAG